MKPASTFSDSTRGKTAETCYMCETVATSREHSPPQCLFPSTAIIGRDLRRNLITVPSCDEHNGHKSGDDEFLQAVILMFSVMHSDVAKPAFFGKYLRAVRRMPHTYAAFFLDKGTTEQQRLRVLQFDRQRFNRCIDRLARALYFAEHGVKWTQRIACASPNIYTRDETGKVVPHVPTMEAVWTTQQFLKEAPIRGENSEVFKYRLRFDTAEGILAFEAQFYESFDVYAFSSSSNSDSDDKD